MKEYFLCLAFWMAFTIAMYWLGKATANGKKEKTYTCYLISGYLVYSFFVALGGIIIQILNASWDVFAAYMLIVWLSIVVIFVIKRKVILTDNLAGTLIKYFSEHWFLVVVCIGLTMMLFFYYNAFWYGNHFDDGYYITKVSTLPYDGFRFNYPVGIEKEGIDSYIFNTWELEASVYVKVLQVKPTLFLRLFQSSFNYFLFLNGFKLLAEKLLFVVKHEYKKNSAQFVVGIGTLFCVYYLFLMDSNLLFVRDMSQTNSGMYFGSSIVKLLGILWLIVFYLQEKRITTKMIIGVGAISIVLISKSSIALPIVILTVCAYFISTMLTNIGRLNKIIGFAVLIIWSSIGLYLHNGADIQKETYTYVVSSMKSPVIWICIVVFVLSFLFRNVVVYKLNILLILIGSMMVLPEINDVFEFASVYDFVGGRAWSTFIYTFVMVNSVYLFILLQKFFDYSVTEKFFGSLEIILLIVLVWSYRQYGGELFLTDQAPVHADLTGNLDIILHNPYFIPNSTIHLGEQLERLSGEKGEKIYVASIESSGIDGTIHNLATQLRTFAPDIVSVSAVGRYGVSQNTELYGYNQEYYDDFLWNPSDKTAEKFKREADEYGVNCVVVNNQECGIYLQKIGYELYSVVDDNVYYVWVKN